MRCTYIIDDKGTECAKTVQSTELLNAIAFRNPWAKKENRWIEADICQMHSDLEVGTLIYGEISLQKQITALKEEIEIERDLAKKGELHFISTTFQKIKKLEKKLSFIRNDKCGGCNNAFDKNEVLFPVEVFSSHSRSRHRFHYHQKCQVDLMKKVGLIKIHENNLEKFI